MYGCNPSARRRFGEMDRFVAPLLAMTVLKIARSKRRHCEPQAKQSIWPGDLDRRDDGATSGRA